MNRPRSSKLSQSRYSCFISYLSMTYNYILIAWSPSGNQSVPKAERFYKHCFCCTVAAAVLWSYDSYDCVNGYSLPRKEAEFSVQSVVMIDGWPQNLAAERERERGRLNQTNITFSTVQLSQEYRFTFYKLWYKKHRDKGDFVQCHL